MGIIYKTTNICNGKIYVGKAKTNNPLYLGSGVILSQAIRKYGKSSFQKEILEECSDNIIDEREVYWIAKLRSTDRNLGYNIAAGGTGGDTTSQHPDKENIIEKRIHGLIEWHASLTETDKEIRGKKISESKKGKGNSRKDYSHSDITKQLIKQNQPAKTDEWRKSHAEAMAKRQGKAFTQKYKPVVVDDKEYLSVKHAIDALGIKHRATFYDRVKRGLIKLTYL